MYQWSNNQCLSYTTICSLPQKTAHQKGAVFLCVSERFWILNVGRGALCFAECVDCFTQSPGGWLSLSYYDQFWSLEQEWDCYNFVNRSWKKLSYSFCNVSPFSLSDFINDSTFCLYLFLQYLNSILSILKLLLFHKCFFEFLSEIFSSNSFFLKLVYFWNLTST